MKTGSFITTTVACLPPERRAGIVTELDWSGRSRAILASFADGEPLWLDAGEYTPVVLVLDDVAALAAALVAAGVRPDQIVLVGNSEAEALAAQAAGVAYLPAPFAAGGTR